MNFLFRASEHSFSAASFHKYCDNIPNTFTLIKTNYGKIIAAYTPIIWDKSNTYKHATSTSFLLQVDINQKYSIFTIVD